MAATNIQIINNFFLINVLALFEKHYVYVLHDSFTGYVAVLYFVTVEEVVSCVCQA